MDCPPDHITPRGGSGATRPPPEAPSGIAEGGASPSPGDPRSLGQGVEGGATPIRERISLRVPEFGQLVSANSAKERVREDIMMQSKVFLVILVLAGPFGCGGNVKESGEDTAAQDKATDAETTTSSTDPSSGETTAEATGDTRRLGECVEGFEPQAEPERSCNWLGDDGLCYDTREAACNCVCPRDHDSFCLSGFYDGEGSRTEVYCS